jgi:hypothetical protein
MKSPTPLSEAETQLTVKDLALLAAHLLPYTNRDETVAARRALDLIRAAEKVLAEREKEDEAYWESPEGEARRAERAQRIEEYKREHRS